MYESTGTQTQQVDMGVQTESMASQVQTDPQVDEPHSQEEEAKRDEEASKE